MNELFFFRHYMTELEDPALSAFFRRYKAKGYGFYWYFLERLYSEPTNTMVHSRALLKELGQALGLRPRKVKEMLVALEDLGLIVLDHRYRISSDRVKKEVKEVMAIRARNKRRRENEIEI